MNLLPLAILCDDFAQLALLLGSLAVALVIADEFRVGHLARQVFKARLDAVQLFLILHVRSASGDHQLAALLLFKRHRAVQGVNGDCGLIVGWWFRRDLLEPQSGSGQAGASMLPRRLAAKRIIS